MKNPLREGSGRSGGDRDSVFDVDPYELHLTRIDHGFPALQFQNALEWEDPRAAPEIVVADNQPLLVHPLQSFADVSVIVTCHNYGRFLPECLNSLLSQTLPPAEILVVLDGCTDDSAAVVDQYRGWGVRGIEHNACDVYLSRRLGIKQTVQPYIVFFDADDVMTPGYLAACMKVMQQRKTKGRRQLAVVTGYIEHFGYTAFPEGDSRNTWRPDPTQGGNVETANYLISESLVLREALASLGGTGMEDMTLVGRLGQDWETWKKLKRAGWEFDKADAKIWYRRHESNATLKAEGAWGDKVRSGLPKHLVRQRTKAIFVTSHLNHGGVSAHFKMLATWQKDVEWIATVIDEGGSSDPEITQWLTSHMPVLGSEARASHAPLHSEDVQRYPTSLAALNSVLDQAEIVYGWGNTAGMLKHARQKRPVLGTVFGNHGSCNYTYKFAKAALPYVDKFICIARSCSDLLPPERRKDGPVVWGGVDLPRLGKVRMSRTEIRKSWNVSPGEIVVGLVSRWSGEKNPLIVPAAVAELRSRLKTDRIKFLTCGPQSKLNAKGVPRFVPEAQRAQAEKQASPVIWTFASEETPWTLGDVYRGLDVLVISSHAEGAPLVLMEAIACGLPVVSTPVGCGPEMDRKCPDLAVFVPLDPTPAHLANGILEALGSAHQARLEKNRDWVLSHCSPKSMVSGWERIMCGVVKSKQGGRT